MREEGEISEAEKMEIENEMLALKNRRKNRQLGTKK